MQLPPPALCCVGVGPLGASHVNTVIKPLHWSLLHLSNPQHQGAECLPALLLLQWDQTVPSRPALGKPMMELPPERPGQVRLAASSLRSIPHGFSEEWAGNRILPLLSYCLLKSADQDSHAPLPASLQAKASFCLGTRLRRLWNRGVGETCLVSQVTEM